MMNKKEIFRKIGSIIVEINEQYQYLSDNPEMLNDLELELFSANADFLAEHVKVLKKVNLAFSVNENTEEPALHPEETDPVPAFVSNDIENTTQEDKDMPDEAAVPMPVLSEETETAPVLNNQEVEDEQEQKIPEPSATIAEVIPQPDVISETPTPVMDENPVIKEVVIPEKVTSIEIPLAAQSISPAPTLNDIISAQKAASVSAPVLPPVSDLKSAISLNDKLLFIKDLFNGYSLAYSEAIELVNRFDSFEAADNFLKSNYSVKNNWASRQATADKFYEILSRRFSK